MLMLTGLISSLTATEALIEFVIDMYRSTFLCLLELVIRGGLSVVIAAVSEVSIPIQGLSHLPTDVAAVG
jgi:hypothetical protein